MQIKETYHSTHGMGIKMMEMHWMPKDQVTWIKTARSKRKTNVWIKTNQPTADYRQSFPMLECGLKQLCKTPTWRLS